MSNTNQKIGKSSKIISRDIYEFSFDKLRNAISTQNSNLEIVLNRNISLVDNKENINLSDQTIDGEITILSDQNTIKKINDAFDEIKENVFTDFNIKYNKHYEEKLDPDLPTNSELARINKLLFGVDFEYNNFYKDYENYLFINKNIPEINLPNFYDIIDNDLINKVTLVTDNPKEYFNNPQDIISSTNLQTDFETIINDSYFRFEKKPDGTFKYLSIDEYLKKYNFLKDQFPFNTKIKIYKHLKEENNFSSLIHDEGVYSALINFFISNNTENILIQKDFNKNIITKNIQECVLSEQFKRFITNTYQGDSIAFFSKLNSLSETKVKNFAHILSGKEDYTEVMAYKIEKYEYNSDSVPKLLQVFYIPNISQNTIEYIDSQIYTNKNYLYRIKLLLFSFSYNYKYTNKQLVNNGIKLFYNYSPVGKIFELDSNQYADSIANHKLPPINPDIELIPYIGVSNKIKCNITAGTGEKIAKIEFFNLKEVTQIPNLQLMQLLSQVPVGSDRLKYSSSIPIRQYQVFRSIIKPNNYSDFDPYLYKVIDITDSYSVSFEDSINSNTKYYYTFRSIDYQGSVSNPTDIYELEIINDNGTIIPNINIIELNKSNKLKVDTKQMRAFIKIQPAIAQKVLENISNNSVKLGINKESVWNRDFKIRIKSKQTGKIIDFNINFTYNTKS
jgi:hypothetical protein